MKKILLIILSSVLFLHSPLLAAAKKIEGGDSLDLLAESRGVKLNPALEKKKEVETKTAKDPEMEVKAKPMLISRRLARTDEHEFHAGLLVPKLRPRRLILKGEEGFKITTPRDLVPVVSGAGGAGPLTLKQIKARRLERQQALRVAMEKSTRESLLTFSLRSVAPASPSAYVRSPKREKRHVRLLDVPNRLATDKALAEIQAKLVAAAVGGMSAPAHVGPGRSTVIKDALAVH